MWPLAEVRGTCSGGSKRQVIGEGFRARRAIQAHANPRTQYLLHLTLKFPTSHLICGILNINVVRHYMLEDEKVFPDTMPYPIYLLSSFAKLINYKPIHNQPYCVPHLRNKLEQWPKSGTPGSPMAKTGYTRKPDGQNRVPPFTLVPGRHFIGQRPPRPDSGRI